MPEDLIAFVTKGPVFRGEAVDVHVGHRIEVGEYACLDLSIQLARPYRAQGYRIQTVSHAQKHYGKSEAEIKNDHPFMGIHEGDFVVLLHADKYTVEKMPTYKPDPARMLTPLA